MMDIQALIWTDQNYKDLSTIAQKKSKVCSSFQTGQIIKEHDRRDLHDRENLPTEQYRVLLRARQCKLR